ncbi:MAG: hypothetical protein JXR77_05215 [Lentisphaeria bacterium]|nr:hypothetical protein [Lentisphaeria bacterium]
MDPYRLANVSLEISPKPFFDLDDKGLAGIFADLFRQWYSLLKHADEVSLLWWLSDGTDLLTYNGNLEEPIEWMAYLGYAHKTYDVPREKDPHGESIVGCPRIYHPRPRRITCGDAKRMVAIMKAAAREALGADLRVGYAFDPGAEFSNHPFRYRDHPELLMGERLKCIDCTALLHADGRAFAGFPGGIPEGLPFGTFFGRQAQAYLTEMGFDYLWLSNSFGFGRSPYAFGGAGQFFDGRDYRPEGNTAVRDAVFRFWQLFRSECSAIPVECRGTDFTAGMNLVNHATPYDRIYAEIPGLTPPPNTPWPALTGNHGLALAGYLSEISGYRGKRFPFRFYTSDPWWCNTPWNDRWERRPHDIYLSMAVSRLDAGGRIATVNDVKFLSVDTSWGELPEQIPDEVIPHVKRALSLRPDAAAPVLWVYPFREYHDYTFRDTARMPEVMAGDLLIQQAYNNGLPLSGVVTTEALAEVLTGRPDRLAGSVLVTPVPDAGTAWEDALARHLEAGGRVLCYGPTGHASPAWRERLGLAAAEVREGCLPLRLVEDIDRYTRTPAPARCCHPSALSGGGLGEVPADREDPGRRVLAWAGDRVAALVRGRLAWVRGSSSITEQGIRGRGLGVHDPLEMYLCENLFRQALAALGWTLAIDRPAPSQAATHLMLHRCRNAFVFSGYTPERDVVYRLRTPLGAPMLPGRDTRIEAGHACIPAWPWFHEECRIFVEQDSGEPGLHAISPKHYRYRRRWALTGLREATVRFFPETGCFQTTQILLNTDLGILVVGDPYDAAWKDDCYGRYVEIRGVSGTLTFGWSPDDAPVPVRREEIDPSSAGGGVWP